MTIKLKNPYMIAMGDQIMGFTGQIETVLGVRLNKKIMPWMYEVETDRGHKLVLSGGKQLPVIK